MSFEVNIGKYVRKGSFDLEKNPGKIKPFKSGRKVNTVKSVIVHPKLNIPAYTFEEDDSYVECRRCHIVDTDLTEVEIDSYIIEKYKYSIDEMNLLTLGHKMSLILMKDSVAWSKFRNGLRREGYII